VEENNSEDLREILLMKLKEILNTTRTLVIKFLKIDYISINYIAEKNEKSHLAKLIRCSPAVGLSGVRKYLDYIYSFYEYS
jgi:hypothetical protein